MHSKETDFHVFPDFQIPNLISPPVFSQPNLSTLLHYTCARNYSV